MIFEQSAAARFNFQTQFKKRALYFCQKLLNFGLGWMFCVFFWGTGVSVCVSGSGKGCLNAQNWNYN